MQLEVVELFYLRTDCHVLTAQRLQDRIKQHVPKWLRQHTTSQRVQPNQKNKRKQLAPECDSAIGQHLLENDQCAANYNDDQFSILDTAHSFFHLSLLEASYIKVRRHNLCKQREFVYALKLFKQNLGLQDLTNQNCT